MGGNPPFKETPVPMNLEHEQDAGIPTPPEIFVGVKPGPNQGIRSRKILNIQLVGHPAEISHSKKASKKNQDTWHVFFFRDIFF